MSIFNKAVLGMAVGVGLTMGLMTGSAYALCPIVYDTVRTVWFTTQGANRLMSLTAEKQAISSKKKELKLWETRKNFKEKKNESKKTSEDGGEESEGENSDKYFPEGVYYQYMKDATATGSEEYLPAQSDAKAQEDYIRKNFFYDSDLSKVTEEDKQKVQNRRLSYVEALASEVLSLSVGVRENIASELSILKKAKTTAGGAIQQVDLLVQTKKVMVEQKAADILLQAKLLEFEAAQLILGLNPQRVEKPSDSETDPNEEGGNDDE